MFRPFQSDSLIGLATVAATSAVVATGVTHLVLSRRHSTSDPTQHPSAPLVTFAPPTPGSSEHDGPAPSSAAANLGANPTFGQQQLQRRTSMSFRSSQSNADFAAAAASATASGHHQQQSAGSSVASRLDRISDELAPYPIWRIAVTGGPCSGKSSSMKSIKSHFEAKGFKVFIAPEVATILIDGGLDFGHMCKKDDNVVEAQRIILQTIIRMEDSFYALAKAAEQPSIILCDRGTMDGRAYCSDSHWQKILDLTQLSVEELRDVRYDAVIHLVTAAIGAPEFYTTANNTARRETVEEAARIDAVTMSKWLGHRLIGVIDNSTDFKGKIQRVINFVEELTSTDGPGRRANVDVYRLTLDQGIRGVIPTGGKIVATEVVEVTVHGLIPRPRFAREELIRRCTKGADIYFLRGRQGDGRTNYVRITEHDYQAILEERIDPSDEVVCKRHTCFFVGQGYYTATQCIKPASMAGKCFLQGHPGAKISELPGFFQVGEKVPYAAMYPESHLGMSVLSGVPFGANQK